MVRWRDPAGSLCYFRHDALSIAAPGTNVKGCRVGSV
jgi:hypothetical protein